MGNLYMVNLHVSVTYTQQGFYYTNTSLIMLIYLKPMEADMNF